MSSTIYRLHLSPLPTPASLPSSDILQFFSRFGQPTTFERPLPDALGNERNYGYLAIDFGEKGEKGLVRCINTTSSTVWRGIKLKVSLAKPSFESRLEKERASMNPDGSLKKPTERTDKQLRSAKLKKRRERKRRILEIGGRMDGDMRIVDLGMDRKYWHSTETEPPRMIRPLLTRPTHPLPPRVLPSTTSTSLAKRAKKSRGKALTKSKRTWVDPSAYNPTYRTVFPSIETEVGEAMEWRFDSDRWTLLKPRSDSDSGSGSDPELEIRAIEEISSPQTRLAQILDEIASTSTYPSTIVDHVPLPSKKPSKKKPELVALDEMGEGLDDDDLWGIPEGDHTTGGLFDDYLEVRSEKKSISVDALPSAGGLDDDDLFNLPVTIDTEDLFSDKPLVTTTTTKRPVLTKTKMNVPALDVSSSTTTTTTSSSSRVVMDLKTSARSEKKKGMDVLAALGL